MDLLKQIFPLSFGSKDVASLVIKAIVYLVVGVIAGVLIGVLNHIPVVNWITGIVGSFIGIYVLIGIVVAILDYLKILK